MYLIIPAELLTVHSPLPAGEPGLQSARDRQQEHGGAHTTHVRRGPAPDLHADAPRLVPALHQLCDLQAAGAAQRRGQRRGRQRGRHPVQRPAQAEYRVTHSTPRQLIGPASNLV